ncbi:aldehyde ferredoxin oxidoreductase [archaeon]|nr:MAG: aldehyde ferredoxin oxidoreductase [archaeon]
MNGWCNSVLRIDLSNETIREERPGRQLLETTIGGLGLATHYFYEETHGTVDPLSPKNPVVLATGPLTGTGMASTGRACMVTTSPLTGFFLQSHSGGQLGPEIKYAGHDAIIIEGAARRPVYIFIDDDHCSIESADAVWGKGVKTATRMLEAATDPEARVLTIGPAGENLVPLATVQNDVYRSFGRGGPGAVLGCKNLKAVVVRGTKGVEVADPDAVLAHLAEARDLTHEKLQEFTNFGTTPAARKTNNGGVLPTKNFTSGRFDHIDDISGETLHEHFWKGRRACFACPIGCTQYHATGGIRSEGPEYETLFSLGSNILNDDLETLIAANELCNDMGIDTISSGVTLAWAMEASERGVIDDEVPWGDGDTILSLLRTMATREGLGETLSGGARHAAKTLGGESFAMHVKGMELPGYDPRGTQGMALSYSTSSRGACHLRAPIYVDEVFAKRQPAYTLKDKAGPVVELENTLAIADSLIVCRFSFRGIHTQSMDAFPSLIEMATGHAPTLEDLTQAAERLWTQQHLFNIAQGWTSGDDTVPDRFFSEDLDGVRLDRNDFIQTLHDYYALRGWDENGIPSEGTLTRLGLR